MRCSLGALTRTVTAPADALPLLAGSEHGVVTAADSLPGRMPGLPGDRRNPSLRGIPMDTEIKASAPANSAYTPAVMTSFGTVTEGTLGNKQHDPADDTQYWNAS